MSGGDTCSNRGRYFSSHQQLQLRMASGFPGAGQNTVGGDLPFDFFFDFTFSSVTQMLMKERENGLQAFPLPNS